MRILRVKIKLRNTTITKFQRVLKYRDAIFTGTKQKLADISVCCLIFRSLVYLKYDFKPFTFFVNSDYEG